MLKMLGRSASQRRGVLMSRVLDWLKSKKTLALLALTVVGLWMGTASIFNHRAALLSPVSDKEEKLPRLAPEVFDPLWWSRPDSAQVSPVSDKEKQLSRLAPEAFDSHWSSSDLVQSSFHPYPPLPPHRPKSLETTPASDKAAQKLLDAVDKILEELKSANLAFNTPEHARVGKTLIVEAKLSTHLAQNELKNRIEEPGKLESASLKVSNRMAATLSNAAAFDISPAGPQEQWISDKEETTWIWQVSPKVSGDQTLFLSFDAIISIDEKDNKRHINTFKKRINVEVDWPETFGEWLELIKKYGENLWWIWAMLVIPIGGGTWRWIKRKDPSKLTSAEPLRPLDKDPSEK